MTKSGETIERLAASLRELMNFPDIARAESYSIGQLSSHLGVSLRTLRFYEQSGLLCPSREGARRVYADEDRQRLEVIVALREFEVSLAGIKSLMQIVDGGGPNIEERILMLYDQMLDEVAAANRLRVAELDGIINASNGRVASPRRDAVGGFDEGIGLDGLGRVEGALHAVTRSVRRRRVRRRCGRCRP